jgi:hypothetical protein
VAVVVPVVMVIVAVRMPVAVAVLEQQRAGDVHAEADEPDPMASL